MRSTQWANTGRHMSAGRVSQASWSPFERVRKRSSATLLAAESSLGASAFKARERIASALSSSTSSGARLLSAYAAASRMPRKASGIDQSDFLCRN